MGSEKNTKQLEGSTRRRCQPEETLGDDEYLGSLQQDLSMTLRVHGESVDWPKRVLDKVFFLMVRNGPRKWKVIGKNEESGWFGGWSCVSYRPSVN